jgi:hypothetical protein
MIGIQPRAPAKRNKTNDYNALNACRANIIFSNNLGNIFLSQSSNSGLRCSGSPLSQVYWTLQIVLSFSFTAGTSFCGKATMLLLVGARVLVKNRRRQYRYPALRILYFGHAGYSIRYAAHYGWWKPAPSISCHGQEIHPSHVALFFTTSFLCLLCCCTCSYFKSLADPAPIYRVSYDTFSALLLYLFLSLSQRPLRYGF